MQHFNGILQSRGIATDTNINIFVCVMSFGKSFWAFQLRTFRMILFIDLSTTLRTYERTYGYGEVYPASHQISKNVNEVAPPPMSHVHDIVAPNIHLQMPFALRF